MSRIGIDIGTHSIKCVQLCRTGGAWRLGTYRILELEHANATSLPPELLLEAVQRTVGNCRGLRRAFHGRRAASVLPMSLVEQRLLQIPPGTTDEMNDLVREDLFADELSEPREFGWWPADNLKPQADLAKVRVSVVSASTQVATRLAHILAEAGFDCEKLDAMPMVLARAAELAEATADHPPVGMLDLGYQTPMLTCVVSGVPVLSRQLSHCGLHRLLADVGAAVGISAAECQVLLQRHNLFSVDLPPSNLAAAIYGAAAPYLEQLVEQLERTLSYVQRHYRQSYPQRLWLCGGGGTLPGLADWLGEQLSQPLASWRLAGSQPASLGDRQPLLAAAAVLCLPKVSR
jgi:Tfp pilus assembly PilM family ATPase